MIYQQILLSSVLFIGLTLTSIVLAHGEIYPRIEKLTDEITQHSSTELLLKRGLLFRDDNHLNKALRDFKTVLHDDVNHVDALYFAAETALNLGKIKEANTFTSRFLKQIKKQTKGAAHAKAYRLFAEIYAVQGKLDSSIVFWKKSLALQAYPIPNHWLKLAALQSQQKNYTAALTTLQQALARLGNNVSIQDAILETALKAKSYPIALSIIEQQLSTSASLRTVILLLKKSDTLYLADQPILASNIKQQALKQFKQLPSNKKHSPVALSIQQQLASNL